MVNRCSIPLDGLINTSGFCSLSKLLPPIENPNLLKIRRPYWILKTAIAMSDDEKNLFEKQLKAIHESELQMISFSVTAALYDSLFSVFAGYDVGLC